MSTRNDVPDDEDIMPDILEREIKEEVDLSYDNKLIILQTLMPNAHELFETFNPKYDKEKTKKFWVEAISELKECGIVFNDWCKLKETVRDWFGLAIARAEVLEKSKGRQAKQLIGFDNQCLSLIRACKDNFSVDLTQCFQCFDISNSDTEQNNDDTESEISFQPHQIEMVNENMDIPHITSPASISSSVNKTNSNASEISFQPHQIEMVNENMDIPDITSPASISSSVNKTNSNASINLQDWSEKYFKSLADNETVRLQTQMIESKSIRYMLFLKSTLLEQQHGLNEMQIQRIRQVASMEPIDGMPVTWKPPSVFVTYDQETDELSIASSY